MSGKPTKINLDTPTTVKFIRGLIASGKSTPDKKAKTAKKVMPPVSRATNSSTATNSSHSTSSTSASATADMDLLAKEPVAAIASTADMDVLAREPVATTTSQTEMDALAPAPAAKPQILPMAMSSVDPYAGKKSSELQSIFLRSVSARDFNCVNDLLKMHSEKLGNALFRGAQDAIDNDIPAMLKIILPFIKEPKQIESLDQDLPSLIHKRKLEVLKVLLETTISMRSLMTIASFEILNKLKNDPSATEMIDVLLTASISRHPAITFRISRVLMDMQMPAGEFNEALDQLLVDAVDFTPFKNPCLTPQGQTFSSGSIKESNPLTRDPIQANQLRANLLLEDLMMFILQNPSASERTALFPPMLLSLYDGQPLVYPVMLENGLTVEAKGQEGAYTDFTLRDCCEYYRKLSIFSARPALRQPEEAVSATKSNAPAK